MQHAKNLYVRQFRDVEFGLVTKKFNQQCQHLGSQDIVFDLPLSSLIVELSNRLWDASSPNRHERYGSKH